MGNVCLFGRLPSNFPRPQPGREIASLNFEAKTEEFCPKLIMNVAALPLKYRLKFSCSLEYDLVIFV